MNDNNEIKKDLNDSNSNQSQNSSIRNSSKIQSFHNSAKIVNKQFTGEKSNKSNEPNFIKRSSPIQPMPLFNLNFLKEENSNNELLYTDNNNYKLYPNYSPLTPQLLPNDHRRYSKKNFPSKEEVCKGNPDFSQKLKIPSSSPITQYFNMDTAFNKDFGFQLEGQTPNNYAETPISHLSNVSQSDMFNCSPSDFFNRGNNADIGKNMKGINISDQAEHEIDEDKNRNGKEEVDELYSMNIEHGNEDNNFQDDNNIILNRINELKSKKTKDKIKTSNNSKTPKNAINKNNINNNESDLLLKENFESKDIKINNLEMRKSISNEIPDKSKQNNHKFEELNINYNIFNDNQFGGNKEIIKEDNTSSTLISPEMSKKFGDYYEKYDINYGSPEYPKIEIKNNSIMNKSKMKDNKNMNLNNISENNNMNYNPKMNSNLNNLNNNNDNLNYINNMNISCTNLNINNFTNLNKNPQNNNFNVPNQQLSYYLQNQSVPNNLQNIHNSNNNTNKNKKQKQSYKNNNNLNYNNFQNDLYNDPKIMNYYEQMNGMNINSNPYYPQNNYINNQGYQPIFNNNINNSQLKNNNDYNKRKKIKKLENSLYKDKPLNYLANNLNLLGKDQGACRYLQELLNDNPLEAIQFFYEPLCENILELINDQFGNYLIQKIITYLNEEQLLEIMRIISQNFFEICCSNYGTRALQKLIDYLKTPKLANYFYQLMKPLITPLLKELNGTFVVQKFAKVHYQYSNEINDIIVENSPVLSTHRHGCCVVQKYLEIKDPIMTPNLLDKLIENCLLLIIDQFGNYVIQTILLMGNKKYGNKLAEKIAENVVYYAKHKYSSNVVEKCFDYCDGIYLNNLMTNVQKKENLIELILDEHGNYVVQKVLLLSPPLIQKNMLKLIVPVFDKLKKYPYGDRVINRLIASYPIINDKLFLNEIK